MKKIATLGIMICMILLTVLTAVVSTFATDEPVIWDGSMSQTFSGGKGTESDPYLISNGGDLKLLSYIFNNAPSSYTGIGDTLKSEIAARGNPQVWTGGKYFKLTNNIYLNDTSEADWKESNPNVSETIGNRKGMDNCHRFLGTIDGAGYSIYGMYMTPSNADNLDSGIAFIGTLNGTIKNLGIADSVFMGTTRVAAFVYCLNKSTAKVDNCWSNAEIDATVGEISSDRYGNDTGGIVAYLWGGTVSNCVFEGKVNGIVSAGGIVGAAGNDGSPCTIKNCLMLGTVTYDREADNQKHIFTGWATLTDEDLPFAAAIVGNFSASNGAKGLKNCYALEDSFSYNGEKYLVQPTIEVCSYLELGNSETKYANYFNETGENEKNIIRFVSADDIKGENAKTTLKNFDFVNYYSCVKNGTVCLTSFPKVNSELIPPEITTEPTDITTEPTDITTEPRTQETQTNNGTEESTDLKPPKNGCKSVTGLSVVLFATVAGAAVCFQGTRRKKH